MMLTLLKHEWRRTRFALASLIGVLTLIGVIGVLVSVAGWSVLSGLGMVVGVICAVILLPAVQLLMVADYWRSGYGRTGYFTHSIPVRGSTIFWAKLIWATLVSVFALLVSALLALLIWWAASSIDEVVVAPSLTVISDAVSTVVEVTPWWILITGAVVLAISLPLGMVAYYYSVSVGNESWLASLGAGGPIVVYLVVYTVSQFLSTVGIIAIPVGIGMTDGRVGLEPFNFFDDMAYNEQPDVFVPVGFLAVYLPLSAYLLWRTVRSWNHKVALR